jgi:hypothetical protein
LTKVLGYAYNTLMSKQSGIEWNQQQAKIAYEHIANGKSAQQLEKTFKHKSVWKVLKALEAGQKSPTMDPAEIAKLPPPTLKGASKKYQDNFAAMTTSKDSSGSNDKPPGGGKNDGKPPEGTKNDGDGTTEKPKTGYVLGPVLKLKPENVECPLTPIMQLARIAATREFGWREDMPWENFLDTCLYHLFKYWGVTLQGYVVDEPEKQEVSNVG